MITSERVVLLIPNYESKIFLERFEALVCVEKPSEIPRIWKLNKTPCMLANKRGKLEIIGYKLIDLSENLVGDITRFVEYCHDHGFECGEYRTGEVYDTKKERCILCELANYRGMNDLAKYNQFVEQPVDCIIYDSPNFYCVPELGALKKGYLMIVPKQHILSVAQFPESIMSEYHEVCRDVEEILKRAFNGKVVVFMEHGSGPSGKTSHKKSIVHAHTHAIVDWVLKKKYQNMVQMRVCNDISVAKTGHYFSYQEGADGTLMLSMDPKVYVQRQFPRQVMAMELELPPDQYNWRVHRFDENIDTTLFCLHKALSKEHEGTRIWERTRGFVTGYALRPRRIVHE